MLFSGDVVLADKYDDLVSDELKCKIMCIEMFESVYKAYYVAAESANNGVI